MKPIDYPLPWCDELDVAYWKINMFFLGRSKYYREKVQVGKPMSKIIPILDRRIPTIKKIWRKF